MTDGPSAWAAILYRDCVRRAASLALLVAVASCSPTTDDTPDPDPLVEACIVVDAIEEVLASFHELSAELEEAGYRFTSNPRPSENVLYRQWRVDHLDALEKVRDEVTVLIVDARGLVVDANRYGGIIMNYAQNRQNHIEYILDTADGGLVRGEFSSVLAEYDVVQQRCVESGEEQSAG